MLIYVLGQIFYLSGVLHTAEITLGLNISEKIKTKFENNLASLSGAQIGLNHEKNGGRKSRDTLPLKSAVCRINQPMYCTVVHCTVHSYKCQCYIYCNMCTVVHILVMSGLLLERPDIKVLL